MGARVCVLHAAGEGRLSSNLPIFFSLLQAELESAVWRLAALCSIRVQLQCVPAWGRHTPPSGMTFSRKEVAFMLVSCLVLTVMATNYAIVAAFLPVYATEVGINSYA